MWESVIGHAAVKEALRERLRAHRLPHALLLCGVRGIGKSRLAHVLARTLLCEKQGDVPCGTCASCRAVEAGTHPDFLCLEPTSKGKGSAMIRMEEMHGLLTALSRKPILSKQFVAVIDDAERMNETAANRLLKTLEEPQGRVTFILITESRTSLLPTIVSRVMPVRFGMLSREETVEVLKQAGLSETRAMELAPLAFGSPGRALAFHEGYGEKGRALGDAILKVLSEIKDSDIWRLGDEAHALSREDAGESLRVLSLYLRDLLVLTMDGEAGLYFMEKRDAYLTFLSAGGLTAERIEACMTLVLEAMRRQSSNAATRLLFENLLLNMQKI
ncbi:DNA polymerase III subunit delta' [Selenomonas sp. TAMA-11512]|uniref:DNA polymerase III subunit delta' n=1 Tax=Selenomonas sp. TAMA-11512 TaxID=3095337 RepID=UPI00308C9DCC|nr:DNA polymerase III subunit delta' [Selenomonas sp. TAMA-11512]